MMAKLISPAERLCQRFFHCSAREIVCRKDVYRTAAGLLTGGVFYVLSADAEIAILLGLAVWFYMGFMTEPEQ